MSDEVIKKTSWKTILVVWISILGLVTGIQLVQKNLDGRSKATYETENIYMGEEYSRESNCGLSNGITSSIRPIGDLCESGDAIWLDSVGDDGDFNWICTDEDEKLVVECSALLE